MGRGGGVSLWFFLGLENERHEKGSVSSVFDSEGQEVFSLSDMIQAHERFYSSLFSEEPIDPVAQSHLFEHVTCRLSDAERESCEGLLSLNEASEALRLSNRNKTPGYDSLTVEFYSAFWSLLGPLLVDMFNESLAHRELCDSMKSSVTRLVHKKDDRRNLKNWRPISLLNVDYKICSKALSLRLKKLLGSILDPDQTCSVPGRSISSNLALLRDTLDFIERTGETVSLFDAFAFYERGSVDSGGLGLKDFSCQGRALRLVALVTSVSDSSSKGFYLAKYFCGSVLAPLRPEWAGLRDNLTPSAARPTAFYASVLSSFQATDLPPGFTYTSRAFYKVLLANFCTIPIFPALWSGFVPSRFSLSRHWGLIRDSFTENYKNDLAWLITLRAVKVRHSLHTWGYIRSPRCALCARLETIDHCFLACRRVKLVWSRFVPMLSALLSAPFVPNCPFVFFYQFPVPERKCLRLLLYIIKSILCGIWKFHNKATFHNGGEDSKAIAKFIISDVKRRIQVDFHRFSQAKFNSIWVHPAVCKVCADKLVFFF